jgi:hypothetical protein
MFSSASVTVGSPTPRVSFATTGSATWPVWDRFLLIDGQRAYWLGNVCGTCAFLFQRCETFAGWPSTAPSPSQISERLRLSQQVMAPAFLATLGSILQRGNYRVLWRPLRPAFVESGSHLDYFQREQIDLYGPDCDGATPHSPQTPYYRCADLDVCTESRLFEFVVPLQPPAALNPERVAHYMAGSSSAQLPTALAVGVLDVKGPADPAEGCIVGEHWCLTNYLLDGHHKFHGAAASGQPIQLLTFLSEDMSCASTEQLDRLASALSGRAA